MLSYIQIERFIPYKTPQILSIATYKITGSQPTYTCISHIRKNMSLKLYKGQSSTNLNCTDSQFINIMNKTKTISQITPVAVTIWNVHRIALSARNGSIPFI